MEWKAGICWSMGTVQKWGFGGDAGCRYHYCSNSLPIPALYVSLDVPVSVVDVDAFSAGRMMEKLRRVDRDVLSRPKLSHGPPHV